MRALIFVLLVLLVAPVYGQVRLGPDDVRPGELVRLNPSLKEGESALWFVNWPLDLDYEVVPDGRVLFAVPCTGTPRIVVTMVALRTEDGRIITRQQRHTINVSGVVDPDPDNGVDPPPPPPGGHRLTRWVVENRGLIPQSATRESLQNVARNYDQIAGKLNEYTTNLAWSNDLQRMNRETLGNNFQDWFDFAEGLQEQLREIQPRAPPTEYAVLLRAVAEGLRQVSQ